MDVWCGRVPCGRTMCNGKFQTRPNDAHSSLWMTPVLLCLTAKGSGGCTGAKPMWMSNGAGEYGCYAWISCTYTNRYYVCVKDESMCTYTGGCRWERRFSFKALRSTQSLHFQAQLWMCDAATSVLRAVAKGEQLNSRKRRPQLPFEWRACFVPTRSGGSLCPDHGRRLQRRSGQLR